MRAMAFAMRDGHEAVDLLWRRRGLFLFRFLSMELGRVCIIVTKLCQTDENQFDIGFNAALYVK